MSHFPTFTRWGRALGRVPRSSGARLAVLALAAVVPLALATVLGLRVEASHRIAAAWPELERRLGPLDPGAYNLPPVPAEQNAFTWLERGAEVLPRPRSLAEQVALDLLVNRDVARWDEAERAVLEEVIGRNRPGLELLHRAAGLERSNHGVDYSLGFSAEAPNYVRLLRADKALGADARWALVHGDGERALRSAAALAALARSLDREPTLLAKLLAAGAEKRLVQVAGTAIEVGADRELLRRLRALLGGLESGGRFHAGLAFDSAAVRHTYDGEAERERERGPLGIETMSLERLYADIVESYVELARAPQRPFTAMAAAIEPPDGETPGLGRLGADGLLGIAAQLAATSAARQLAGAALELRLEALATGRYPETLPAAMAAPDPVAGGAPTYRRLADGSAELSLPEARATVVRWLGEDTRRVSHPPLAWRLPPPPGPPPAAAG